jgi:hypothetical protein
MATYEERRAARQDRIDGRAAAKTAEASAHYKAARAAVEHIPMGQPILVGHHSEGRHRRDLARSDNAMRKSCEASREAERLESTRATSAVLATDDDALDVLAARIAEAEAQQERMRAANKAILAKKGAAGLLAAGFTEAQAAAILKPDVMGAVGFPSYALSNNSANIRRMKERLAALTRAKAATTTTRTVGDVRIVENAGSQRIELHFPGKPSAEVIAKLKASGFRWAPSAQAWQRHLNNAGRYAARHVLGEG